ncbi:hypothetical protein [uncultured Succinivibrio sp.]|uniref:hypothetical protein n=1 Tax=uncultured Succinivibrio sp. TaxID=540749 RepID=UPI0025F974ED|nr:hypothetical protein [uncultured Succinivibrio sp.]
MDPILSDIPTSCRNLIYQKLINRLNLLQISSQLDPIWNIAHLPSSKKHSSSIPVFIIKKKAPCSIHCGATVPLITVLPAVKSSWKNLTTKCRLYYRNGAL